MPVGLSPINNFYTFTKKELLIIIDKCKTESLIPKDGSKKGKDEEKEKDKPPSGIRNVFIGPGKFLYRLFHRDDFKYPTHFLS
jgi:hypothetical protein